MKVISLLAALVLCAGTTACAQRRPPALMIIPDSYVGWIQVEYGVKKAPALPNWKGFRLHKFGRNGKIRTSSAATYGRAKDKIFYSTAQGWKELPDSAPEGNGLIWGEATGHGDVVISHARGKQTKIWAPDTFTAFVGTWEQFRDTKAKRPQFKEEKAALEADK